MLGFWSTLGDCRSLIRAGLNLSWVAGSLLTFFGLLWGLFDSLPPILTKLLMTVRNVGQGPLAGPALTVKPESLKGTVCEGSVQNVNSTSM